MTTATIYRRSGEYLKRNVSPADVFSRAEEYVTMLNEPVLVVMDGQCWEVSDGGDAEELEEWAVDE